MQGFQSNQQETEGADQANHHDDTTDVAGAPAVETVESFDEISLILAVRFILAKSGFSFSTAAVRDLAELSSDVFDPRAAVSAFQHLNFEASFGEMTATALKQSHCPAIGFTHSDQAVVITSIEQDGELEIVRFDRDMNQTVERVQKTEIEGLLRPHFVLCRKLHVSAKPKGKNDWFFGSFLQGKWLYGQVIIAAALTNFLGLSTSLFIMVVYDRVVPNEAIESLIALTIGVMLALGFDFIIKTLRSQFVDRAGKRADTRMLRLIFDKILNMKLDHRKQKAGAMASIVREFDTLREFFTSATLIAIVDIPFIFFFIYVISLCRSLKPTSGHGKPTRR
jgi:ATP-binding cassette, subfamily C, bacterial LapB